MELARRLNIDRAILHLPFLSAAQLAAVYRRSRVALITSDREGFCLPVVEALECGTAVVASDIAVLREIGGDACTYAPLDDIDAWCGAVTNAVQMDNPEARALRRRRAAAFDWDRHAAEVGAVYADVAPHRERLATPRATR